MVGMENRIIYYGAWEDVGKACSKELNKSWNHGHLHFE